MTSTTAGDDREQVEPRRWARLNVPAAFSAPIEGMTEPCGWRLKRPDGAILVCPEEQYGRWARPNLLRISSVINAGTIGKDSAYAPLDKWRLGGVRVDPGSDTDGWASINRALHSGTLPGVLQGASLAFLALNDADFRAFVQRQLTPVVASLAPDFHLCLIDVHERVTARLAAIRGLFAGRHAPETLLSGPEFSGFGAISPAGGYQLTNLLLAPALAATAPYGLGAATTRLAGVAVWLYGRPVDFVGGVPGGTLADLFVVSPSMGSPDGTPIPAPPNVRGPESLAYLNWWVSGADRLLSVALDPTNFVGSDGTYRAHQHMGLLISLERFLAVTQTSLNYARRDGFTRMHMLFDALDTLEGWGIGGYDRTLSAGRLEDHVVALQSRLPAETAEIVLPRCRGAIAALQSVGDGFVPRGAPPKGWSPYATRREKTAPYRSTRLSLGSFGLPAMPAMGLVHFSMTSNTCRCSKRMMATSRRVLQTPVFCTCCD